MSRKSKIQEIEVQNIEGRVYRRRMGKVALALGLVMALMTFSLANVPSLR